MRDGSRASTAALPTAGGGKNIGGRERKTYEGKKINNGCLFDSL